MCCSRASGARLIRELRFLAWGKAQCRDVLTRA
jgi:hypothetical protein